MFNQRTDDYGGSLENRCRLAIEVLSAVREAVGSFFPVEFRMSGSELVPEGYGLEEGIEIKKHVSKPVATIGGLNDPAQMEEIIASGKADIVYMARALLADPELPRKVVENRDAEIIRCLRCFTCMAERAATSTRRCTVNPLIGREMDGVEMLPAPVRKKVLVAGAGREGCTPPTLRQGGDIRSFYMSE